MATIERKPRGIAKLSFDLSAVYNRFIRGEEITNWLVNNGYLKDFNTITEKGIASGIKIVEKEYDGRKYFAPVLPFYIQELFAERLNITMWGVNYV